MPSERFSDRTAIVTGSSCGMDAPHGGAIVSISSTGGMNGLFGLGAYSASKWAVRGLTAEEQNLDAAQSGELNCYER
jgi:NAD(P)-dependent dehydrogenase (short-subunit alcohol dehydrogenase family)